MPQLVPPSGASEEDSRPRRTKSTGNSEEDSRTPPRSVSNLDSRTPPRSASNLGSRTPRSASNLASREESRRRTRSKNNEEWSVPEEEQDEMPLANVASSVSVKQMKTDALRSAAAYGFGSLSEAPSTPGLSEDRPKNLTKGRSNRSLVQSVGEDEDTFEPMEQHEPGHWDLNRSGVIPLAVMAGLWTAAACGVLFAMVYIYRFQEVLKAYQLAEESALSHARLMAADLLLPSVAAVDAVQASLAGGMLRNLSEYEILLQLLKPHFSSRVIEEVELAEPPVNSVSPGSVLLKRVGSEVKLLTDRPDCEQVPGRRGCAAALSASTDDWYKDGYGIDRAWTYVPPEQFWSGPLFIRMDQHLTVCPTLCWKPAFAFVKRATITGGPRAVIAGVNVSGPITSDLNTVLVRVVVSAEIFQEVVSQAVTLSLGEAIVATASGDVVAARDMASGVFIDEENGRLQVNKVWDAKESWSSVADEDMVNRGQQGIYKESGAYSVSVRRLEGPSGDALDLGRTLRLVLGTPIFSFMDPLLFTLTWPAWGVSATPIAVLAFAVLWALMRRKKEAPAKRSSSVITGRSSMVTSSKSEVGSRVASNSRLTTRERFATTGHNRTHLENRRTSLTEALGLRDARKRLTHRQKTIELNQVEEPEEAPQDMVQMSEVT